MKENLLELLHNGLLKQGYTNEQIRHHFYNSVDHKKAQQFVKEHPEHAALLEQQLKQLDAEAHKAKVKTQLAWVTDVKELAG